MPRIRCHYTDCVFVDDGYCSAAALPRRLAISEGMKTLYSDGSDKVCRGVTTLEEVLRVAKRTESE